ncbi:MAG TPA: GNAT family N-acetyltransferase [Thermoleophilaceae bacterium]
MPTLVPHPAARRQEGRVTWRDAAPGPVPRSATLQEEWGELADRTHAPPFLHPGWIASWTDAFADGRLSVLAMRREERLVGIVPFVQRATGTVSPTNWHTPLFGLLAEDGRARGELADKLMAHTRHRLDLSFLETQSADLDACHQAAERSGYRTNVRTIQRSPYVEIDGDWDAYVAGVGGKIRRELRRRRRKLEATGHVSVEFAQPRREVAGLVAEGLEVEGSGWKSDRGTAIASRPETRRFYTEVATWAASRGWLLLAFLRVGGRVAAFDLCLEHDGRVYVLKGGYDPAYRAFAPRTILLHASLERAFARTMRSYEFLGTDEDYKLRWATGVRERRRFQAFPRTVAGVAGYLTHTAGYSAGKRLLGLRDRYARAGG